MKTRLVIWGLIAFQTAAKNLIEGFKSLELKLDREVSRISENHSVVSQKIAEKAAIKQMQADSIRNLEYQKTEKKRMAARTQSQILQSKIN